MRLVLNRVLSLLLGAALVAGGLTALIDGLLVAADRSTFVLDANRSYDEGTSTLLGDDVVLVVSILLGLSGLLLLAVQLWRRPPRRMPLETPSPADRVARGESARPPAGSSGRGPDRDAVEARWWLARRGGEQRLSRAAAAVADVEAAKVRLRRRRRGWRAVVEMTAPQERADASEAGVEKRIRAELDSLAAGDVDVRTSVRRSRKPDSVGVT